MLGLYNLIIDEKAFTSSPIVSVRLQFLQRRLGSVAFSRRAFLWRLKKLFGKFSGSGIFTFFYFFIFLLFFCSGNPAHANNKL